MAASATVNRAIARRLLAEVGGARGYLAAAGLIGLVVTGLILAHAQMLAHLLAGAATGAAAAALRGTLLVLLGVVVARAAAAYAGETAALRGAAVIKERLRSRLAGHVLGLGPAWLGSERPGEIGTLGTSGLDSLDPALGAADLALERVQRANDLLARLDRRSATASGLGVSLASLTAGLTLWGVLLVGVTAVGAGVLSRVPLAVLALTALAAFEAVTALPAAAVQLSHARTAATRIAEVMDASPAVTDPQEPLPLPDAAATARGVSVRMRDAKVRYRPDCPLAVDGVSLDLTPGRRLALVGPSGAGKSTVAAVLFRFQELAGGCVTMDGHDLAGYRAQDVRSLIGGCPQDPHLFNASIAENLRLARPEAPDAALTAMIDRVGLAPWIAGLPHGMNTQVGFGGAAVSGGQRQRIALARALLADPAVLILDEPTAHVDQESRRALAADLLAITVGRSVLLITHDLDGLDQVDEIILLDRGRVVERGAHAWLLANRGLYWRLHGAQFSGWS